jgi:microcystin-dependent protein
MGISSALAGAVNAVPVGSVTAFAGSSAPSGWLLCGGQNVLRAQFPSLFLTIGTTYGAGDGSTTFALPDLRGRTIAGEDDMGGSAANRLTTAGSGINGIVLGASGGSQNHTLTGAQSGTSAHGHTASSGNDSPDHSHATAFAMGGSGGTVGALLAGTTAAFPNTGGASARHTHSITVNNATAANAAEAHSITQPTIVLNYIIKAS